MYLRTVDFESRIRLKAQLIIARNNIYCNELRIRLGCDIMLNVAIYRYEV